MPITPENLVRRELIGLTLRVKNSPEKTHKGISGKIIDESYNTFKIETLKKEKTVTKGISVFIFTLPDGTKVQVDGKLLISRPEDRIKKKIPRW
jgi:ribonuclease P protein subunit POP4